MQRLDEIARLQKLAGIRTQIDEGWKDWAMGAAMTGASIFGGDKLHAQTQVQDKPEQTQTSEKGGFQTYLNAIVKNPEAFLKQLQDNKLLALDYASSYSENPLEYQKSLMKTKIEYALTKGPLNYTIKDLQDNTSKEVQIKSMKDYENLIKDVKSRTEQRKKEGKDGLEVSSNLSQIRDSGMDAINSIVNSTIRGTMSF